MLDKQAGTHASGIGQPVRRKEDLRLLTGKGRYSDDMNLPGQAYAAMLRSPHAHARIVRLDTAAAAKVPGVVAVLTAAELAQDGVRTIPADFEFLGRIEIQRLLPDPLLENRDGSKMFASPYPLLPADRVRFIGQAVVMVVAESVAAAKDGAERVEIEYEPLPVVTDTAAAAEADAPLLWDGTRSNVALDGDLGDKQATEEAFARAAHVVRFDTWIQRVTGVPMEPRTALGVYDKATGRHTLYAGSGGIVRQKREISEILGVPIETVRVVANDIGGNFGTKNSIYPEFPLVVWAAKRLGRPVKWTCERSECFLSDFQGRDLVSRSELALDKNGNFLAIRGTNLSNVGAYIESTVPLRKGIGIMSGLYRIPAGFFRAMAVVSNTPPTIPYRSAGRPEAMYIIERLIDLAAIEHGFDRIALRRRNLIKPNELPYRNPMGVTYDNGEYARVMEEAMRLGNWDTFKHRRAEAKKRGKLRGIGLANYIELTMGNPRERSEITVQPDGSVEVIVGTLSSGQGHETSYAQCVSDWLGVPFEKVRVFENDTDRIPVGGGSHSGRSMRFAGVVMGKASEGVIEKGREIAKLVLEAGNQPVEFAAGSYRVAGTDRAATLAVVAQAAQTRADLPEHLRGPLSAAHEELFTAGGFPYGCHVCEVEIDPDTGVVRLISYAAVDDVGRAINPLILHGQTHGGVVQGVGQVLWEHCHYDPHTGQLLSASFQDYAMPRADLLPSFDTSLSEVPSPTNPLGVRAGGEGGTTPALGVVINAIVDALSVYGIRHIEMPATAERVWRAIQDAKARAG